MASGSKPRLWRAKARPTPELERAHGMRLSAVRLRWVVQQQDGAPGSAEGAAGPATSSAADTNGAVGGGSTESRHALLTLVLQTPGKELMQAYVEMQNARYQQMQARAQARGRSRATTSRPLQLPEGWPEMDEGAMHAAFCVALGLGQAQRRVRAGSRRHRSRSSKGGGEDGPWVEDSEDDSTGSGREDENSDGDGGWGQQGETESEGDEDGCESDGQAAEQEQRRSENLRMLCPDPGDGTTQVRSCSCVSSCFVACLLIVRVLVISHGAC